MISKFSSTWILAISVFSMVHCKPSNNDHDQGSGGGKGDELTVVISFNSLNNNSKDFFNSKLKPIYDEMSKCVKWHFIPCSTSHIVDDILHCKGGVQECKVDALHACAAHYYENDENNLGKFFICMMASGNQMCEAEKCATSSGLDWNKLKGCKPCNEAGQWCDNRWKQLNKIHEPYIPGVIFDWKYNKQSEDEALKDLKSAICNQAKQKNIQCPACGSCGSGGGGSKSGGGNKHGNNEGGSGAGGKKGDGHGGSGGGGGGGGQHGNNGNKDSQILSNPTPVALLDKQGKPVGSGTMYDIN